MVSSIVKASRQQLPDGDSTFRSSGKLDLPDRHPTQPLALSPISSIGEIKIEVHLQSLRSLQSFQLLPLHWHQTGQGLSINFIVIHYLKCSLREIASHVVQHRISPLFWGWIKVLRLPTESAVFASHTPYYGHPRIRLLCQLEHLCRWQ